MYGFSSHITDEETETTEITDSMHSWTGSDARTWDMTPAGLLTVDFVTAEALWVFSVLWCDYQGTGYHVGWALLKSRVSALPPSGHACSRPMSPWGCASSTRLYLYWSA